MQEELNFFRLPKGVFDDLDTNVQILSLMRASLTDCCSSMKQKVHVKPIQCSLLMLPLFPALPVTKLHKDEAVSPRDQ